MLQVILLHSAVSNIRINEDVQILLQTIHAFNWHKLFSSKKLQYSRTVIALRRNYKYQNQKKLTLTNKTLKQRQRLK